MMELLWEEAPRTLTQLAAILREEPGWSKSTVNTMLTRMKAKGLLRVERGGRAQLYYQADRRLQYVGWRKGLYALRRRKAAHCHCPRAVA